MNQSMLPTPPISPRKRGCFFYGCLTFILFASAVVVGIWLFFSQVVKPFFGRYAAEQTVALSPYSATPEQISAVSTRVRAFGDSIAAHQPTAPLSLGERDINALFAAVPEFSPLAQHVRLAIKDGLVLGEFAFPLDDFGFSKKFLNVSASFKVLLEYGLLIVTTDSIAINGEVLPETVTQELKNQNLAADLAREPAVAKVLKELKAIEVVGDTIVVTPK